LARGLLQANGFLQSPSGEREGEVVDVADGGDYVEVIHKFFRSKMSTIDFKVEYMITRQDGFTGLENGEKFITLLANKNTNLKFKKSAVSCDGLYFMNFRIEALDFPNKGKYIHLCIHKKVYKESIEKTIPIIEGVREAIKANGCSIDTLHDDLSYHLSIKVYPEINIIENKLRHLITYVMYKSHGINWVSENSPEALITEMKKRGAREYRRNDNSLQLVNFDKLSIFLFKEYRGINCESVDSELKEYMHSKSSENAAATIRKILRFLPTSNWDSSFQDVVDGMSGEEIQEQWERLYTLRNLIAHNREFTIMQYKETMSLVNSFNQIFDAAIDKTKAPEFTLTGIKKAEEDFNNIINDKSLNITSLRRKMNKLIEDYCVYIGLPTKFEGHLGRRRSIIEFTKSADELIDVMHDFGVINNEELAQLKNAESMIIVNESMVWDDEGYNNISDLMSRSIELMESLFKKSLERKVLVETEPVPNSTSKRIIRLACHNVNIEIINNELTGIDFFPADNESIEEIKKKIQLRLHIPKENIEFD